MNVQKIATRVFIIASVVFALLGILVVLTAPEQDSSRTTFDNLLFKSFFITILIILTSFALSVAGKYLDGFKSK